jgi:hypothetical protein
MLERVLSNTGRYSVVATNRFNAVLQRGLNDNAYTQDELTALLTQPDRRKRAANRQQTAI